MSVERVLDVSLDVPEQGLEGEPHLERVRQVHHDGHVDRVQVDRGEGRLQKFRKQGPAAQLPEVANILEYEESRQKCFRRPKYFVSKINF